LSNSPLTNVDEDGYLRPQPSVDYIASHQANSASSSSPDVAEPSSSEYCYVTPTDIQRRHINAESPHADW